MDYADCYARAIRYSLSAWEDFQQLFKQQPHHLWGGPDVEHTTRLVAADAYEEATGDTHGSNHLRDPKQHVVIEGGKVKRGRFTDRHIQRAVSDVVNHLDHWSGGNFTPPEIDWRDVAGEKPEVPEWEYPTDADEFPSGHRHSYGTVAVDHLPGEYGDYGSRHHIHYSSLGGHLADAIDAETSYGDFGWNTDGVTNTHITDTPIDTHQLGQLPLASHSRLSHLYDGRELEPWHLDDAIREAEHHRNRFQREVDHFEKYNEDDDATTDAHGRLAAAEHVLAGLHHRREELRGHQDAAEAEFNSLLDALRKAPFEEAVPDHK